jgi:hypothetical protein
MRELGRRDRDEQRESSLQSDARTQSYAFRQVADGFGDAVPVIQQGGGNARD